MKQNRRKFLKATGLAGISLASAGMINAQANPGQHDSNSEFNKKSYAQKFNMSGFAAPKLDTVRIGFVGLGNRGSAAVKRMNKIDGVDFKGLSDIRAEQANAAKKSMEGSAHNPQVYSGKEDEWKKMCDRPDIDLIYIATPWQPPCAHGRICHEPGQACLY